MTFNESNMRFQYDDENIYRIENADIITKIEGCKACEFIALKDDKILVVEAKSSSPKMLWTLSSVVWRKEEKENECI